jgi:hypothetical protein
VDGSSGRFLIVGVVDRSGLETLNRGREIDTLWTWSDVRLKYRTNTPLLGGRYEQEGLAPPRRQVYTLVSAIAKHTTI